jgi:hypothetical protein
MRESILRRSLRRPFSGFNLRLRTRIVRSRSWCNFERRPALGQTDLQPGRVSADRGPQILAKFFQLRFKHPGRRSDLGFGAHALAFDRSHNEASASSGSSLFVVDGVWNGLKFSSSIVPSKFSTSAEHDSTQSPQL